MERRSMNPLVPSPQRVICMGSCVFQARPGSPGSDGASPYRLLVVLVLDLF
jgi:hypothetical protein